MGNRKVGIFVNDWANDAGLRLCSPEAECLWLRIYFALHDSPKPGFLLTPAGNPPDIENLEDMLGRRFPDLLTAFADLERNKVFSRVVEADLKDPLFSGVSIGTIYQRRFIIEARRSWINAANARSGHKKKKEKKTKGVRESEATEGNGSQPIRSANPDANGGADPGIGVGIGIGKGDQDLEQVPRQLPPPPPVVDAYGNPLPSQSEAAPAPDGFFDRYKHPAPSPKGDGDILTDGSSKQSEAPGAISPTGTPGSQTPPEAP